MGSDGPVAQFAAMTGTDMATYIRERPGVSAFVLEDGVVYHTYSTYARGLDAMWGMYQWLDRAPLGRNETGHLVAASRPVRNAELRPEARSAAGTSDHPHASAEHRAMDGMPMSGGWTMSMMWMRMPGQSWAGTAASFLAMWSAMMVAMMLPSLVPTLLALSRRRCAVRAARSAHRLTALVGAGYFLVWAAVGAIVFPFGVALTA